MTTRPLSRREREIMDAIFAAGGEASAEEIRTRLTDPPSYSAVRAMLAKLELKGAVRHRERGLRYVYSPTTGRTTAGRSALRRLMDVFFEGSAGNVATALLHDESWTVEDLDRLAQRIEEVKRKKKEGKRR